MLRQAILTEDTLHEWHLDDQIRLRDKSPVELLINV